MSPTLPWRLPLTGLGALLLSLVSLGGPAPGSHAAFPGYNGKLVFTSSVDGNDEIYSINLDGSGRTRLTNHPLTDDGAVWSPDGTKIAWDRDIGDAVYTIWVMNADGTGAHQITPAGSETDEDSPTWSPDGTKIAFSYWGGNNGPDIWVMDADGGNRMNLTDAPGWDRDPSWSPDGTKVAFRSERDGQAEIYVMNADGSNQTRLTNDPGFDAAPKWSADSQRIYWRGGSDGLLHSIRPDGTDEQIIQGTSGLGRPAPSPDGQLIAADGGGLYTMNTDGSDITLVPDTTGDDYRVDWQPLAEPPAYVGDADCNGDVNSVDALYVLRSVAELPTSANCLAAANVKCDDGMTTVDALFILRHVAALPVSLPQGCPEIGDVIALEA